MAANLGTTDEPIETVVVGLDGASSSRHALEWTTRVLAPQATLHLVHAVEADARVVARATIEEWASDLEQAVDLVYHVSDDAPSAALAAVAVEVGAQIVVVGAHHQSKLGPRRVGSTISGLIQQLSIPLAIVPEHTDLMPSGSVVIGVHGSITDGMRWAVGFASAHQLALSLVRIEPSRPLFSIDGLVSMLAYYIDPSVLKSWAVDDLGELADEIQRSTDEELEISWSAPGRRRGPRLVEEGSDAALLVLDVPADPAADVPSWLHHAVRHAPCPIVLFPNAGDERDGG